jgi:hypothetical protein
MSTLPNVNITDVTVDLIILLLVFQISAPKGILYDYFASTMDEREIYREPPNSEILVGADLECSYSGCYIADSSKHTFPYVLELRTGTKCTFTKEG